jgi:sterol desaturase/sphingolipid hydroxylase (fatty acid hydroxylase superfamily)
MKAHSSIRLFKNPLLEALTHVHPSVPFVIWIPIIAYQMVLAFQGGMGLWTAMTGIFLGLVFWTFTEYAMHRWVFHFRAESRFGKYLVFLFHGIHHDDPQDPTRLVMPPVVSLSLGALFFAGFTVIFGLEHTRPFFSGFIGGYLVYDYIHFATHHFRPRTALGRALKEHHMKHHYLKKGGKWGVSSPIWDLALGTMKGE